MVEAMNKNLQFYMVEIKGLHRSYSVLIHKRVDKVRAKMISLVLFKPSDLGHTNV